ncbi:MAG: helix-turn-helix domain-containing protein [Lachnospiraceae bacterium]
MRKKSVVLKYLLSYFAVLLIPFAFSYYYITHSVFEAMKEELKNSNMHNVQQIQFSFDNCIQQMESVVTQFSLNDEVHLNTEIQDIESTLLIMDELTRYLYVSDFLYEIGIYTLGDSYIYTSRSSSRLEIFLDSILLYEEVTGDAFYEILSVTEKTIISNQTVSFYGVDKDIITFLVPVNIIDQSEKANIFFLFETDYLESMMSIEEGFSEYILLSQEGEEIFSTNTQNLDVDAIFEYALEQDTDAFEYMGYFIMIQESDYLDMSIISITPLDAVYQTVNQLSVELLLIMLGVFLVGCIVIYVAMEVNYKPIVRIREQILGYVPEQKDEHNEIVMIQNSLDYLVNKNELLFKDTQHSSKVYLLRRLLKGNIADIEEFNQLAVPYHMFYKNEYFIVMILMFKKGENEQIEVDKVEEIVNKYLHGYMYADVQGKYIFVGDMSGFEIELLQETLIQVSTELHEVYLGIDVCIGVGNAYRKPFDIATSYAEAIVATDYRFIKGSNSIIFQHELLTEKNVAYPYYLLEKFQLAFKNQNIKSTQETIDEITLYIKETKCPMHHARSICYDMMSVLSDALSDMGEKELNAKVNGRYNLMLADFTTIDEMMGISKNICINVQAYVREEIKSKSELLIEDIRKEIQNTCLDINFSIEGLAGHFGMTFSNISSVYKNKTGQTIIDYVTDLRMARAKELLLYSDKSVAMITEEIGYVNPSSFIRKFKSLYGVTPKQFAGSIGTVEQNE